MSDFNFFTVAEYSVESGLSISAIYKQIHEKRIKFKKIGKTYYINKIQ